ncbi:cation:proton antiporter [Thalassotalea sp. PLHSN55]|uniref:cation:proton antiporter n=1 Tax=Thalassotalea sp. PLHSN55 TaxID=3435888 RepID=UPI003F86729E
MHSHPGIVLIVLLILLFGLISQLTEKKPFTGPMFFMFAGILVGSFGLNLFELNIESEGVKLLAELTLIIILFVDATLINVKDILGEKPKYSIRLLGIGLPLCMIIGSITAWFFFPEIGIWGVLLIAFILSPTDAALGQAVIKSEKVPLHIRRVISVESGLNDGIALPPILLCLAVLSLGTSQALAPEQHWGIFFAKQLIFGPLVGIAVGLIGGMLIEKAVEKNWMEPTFQRLSCLSLAILCYVLAEYIHGNGFIAAFCGGLFLGTRSLMIKERMQEFGEAEGTFLILSVFLIFGMLGMPIILDNWHWNILIYSVLSLTLIRGISVAIALIGSQEKWQTVAFISWFGPRGIASLLYVLMVVNEIGIDGNEQLLAIVMTTVFLSVVLHGISAVPLAAKFGKWFDQNRIK